MPITLRTRDDLSIDDIIRLSRDHVVKVTPHVGNWTPARLVLPTLGVSILCVDHTIGTKDRNAHPHLLIRGGEEHLLSEHADRLTTHSYVTREFEDGKYVIGTSLSDVHVGALRSLYPGADIVTHAEHLREYREVTLAVLEEATRFSRSLTWWRRVDEEGAVTCYRSRDLPRSWKEFERDIFPLTHERKGWLIHNRISILMDVIVQSRGGKESEIYHLSGPDMVRYLGGEIENLSNMYDEVRKRLGFVRETITFNLIPFASFRFATRTAQASACNALCEELASVHADSVLLRAHAHEAYDIFAESETKKYFTQHDCLMAGERVVVPEVARGWPMATCAAYLTRVRSLL